MEHVDLEPVFQWHIVIFYGTLTLNKHRNCACNNDYRSDDIGPSMGNGAPCLIPMFSANYCEFYG